MKIEEEYKGNKGGSIAHECHLYDKVPRTVLKKVFDFGHVHSKIAIYDLKTLNIYFVRFMFTIL